MLRRCVWNFPLLLVLAAAPGAAQELIPLPELVISATALPTLAERIGSSVTAVGREEIERNQRRSIAELLTTVPGLNIVPQGPSGPTSVFMRGTNSNHVKVMLDGIVLNDPSSPNRAYDFSTFTTFDLDRVEVLRGPQSGLYGADALGGVISITTRRGSGPATGSVVLEGGSYGTFNQSAQINGGTERSHFALTATHLRSDSIPVTPLDLLPPGPDRNNDVHDNWTYHAKFGADLSENFSVNFVARYTDINARITEDDFSVFPGVPFAAQSKTRGKYFHGLGEAAWRLFDGRSNHRAGVTYSDISRRLSTPDGTRSMFDGDRTKYYWIGDLMLGDDHVLVTGLERETERANTSTPFGGFRGDNGNTGFFAELQSAFAGRFFVVTNVRHDRNDAFGGHTTWRIAPAYLIPESGTKLKASYGTAFYAPSLNQLFDPLSGNPNLRPEQSRGVDVGIEQSLFGGRATFGATWFQNDITDLITFSPVFPFTNMNLNEAETRGVEAFIVAQLSDRLRLRADYTHTIAIDATTGNDLLRRPRHKTTLGAIWQLTDRLTLSASAIWVSGWFDVDRLGQVLGVFKTSGNTVVNLAADYRINERVKLFARIDNLFDKRYETPIGWLRPGFSAYAGLRITN
jgi:vitamin B12 transporter